MKNCGRRFHNEVAKYRFLNELIKVVSPKVSSVPVAYSQSEQVIHSLDFEPDCPPYCSHQHFASQYMGDSAPEKVKLKIVEMLYSWTAAFPGETKISEAYQTLKRQGAWRFLVLSLWNNTRIPNKCNPPWLWRPGDAWSGDTAGPNSDSFPSNQTQTSRIWQWGHGKGDRYNTYKMSLVWRHGCCGLRMTAVFVLPLCCISATCRASPQ